MHTLEVSSDCGFLFVPSAVQAAELPKTLLNPLKHCCRFIYIWTQYSVLARAGEEDARQRINIGLVRTSFLEERTMMATKYVPRTACVLS